MSDAFDAADETQVNNRKRRAARDRSADEVWLADALKTRAARDFFWRLLERCHVFEGRGQQTWPNENGWVIPIPVWDAEMGQYIGVGVVGGTEEDRRARLANPPYVDYAEANAVIDAAYQSRRNEGNNA